MRSVALAAAIAAAFGFLAPSDPPAPPTRLADHTVPLAPPADPGDGSLPNGGQLTPFDVQYSAIARLDPALLKAIQGAATAAAADGVTMTITSGWRSPEFQQRLLDNAVRTYGSLAAARQYVQTPAMSKHVTGEAVDVRGAGADEWLITNGSRFGLCRSSVRPAAKRGAWSSALTQGVIAGSAAAGVAKTPAIGAEQDCCQR